MKKLTALILSTAITFQSVGWSQSQGDKPASLPPPEHLVDSAGMFFYSPHQFYRGELDGFIKKEMGEVEVLNARVHDPSARIMNFLQGEGTMMGFGVNPNRENFFDLYGTTSVDVELAFPAPQYGMTRESEGGKRYFPDHDAMHLWALRGVGSRLKDLDNKEAVISRWVKVLMDAEGLATAYNSAYQVKDYWNWRMRQSGASPEQIKQFESQNRGVLSIGSWTHETFMDAVLTNVRGQPFKQNALLKRNITWDQYKAAKDAGVPLLVDLESILGKKGEELFIKHGFAPLFSAASFFREKSGYIDLIKGTRALMAYYYSSHYVRWATEFNIGEDIDTAEKKLAERIEMFKKGQVLGDVVAPQRGQYEVQRVRQLITQLGRKLIELQELGTTAKIFNLKDIQDSNALIAELKKINIQLLNEKEAKTSYSDAQINSVEKLYERVVNQASVRFPIDKYIPQNHRLGYAYYTNFWADPFAIVIDRPVVLNKFVSTKGIFKRALDQRMRALKAEMKGQEAVTIDTTVKPILVAQLEEQAAARYNTMRKGDVVAEGKRFEENYYLNRLEIFRRNVAQQAINFIEQVKEYQHITQEERLQLIELAEYFGDTLDKKMIEFKNRYRTRFIEMSRDSEHKVWLWNIEADIKWATERSQVAMIDILDSLDKEKKFKSLKMKMVIIKKNIDMLASGERIEPSLYDMIRKVTPMKRGLLQTTCSAVSRMCFNQDLTKLIKALPTQAYARDSQHRDVIEVVKRDGTRTTELPQLPKDAVIIIGMNHDHAALDASYLMKIADKLGVDRNLLLTTQSAWPHFSIFKNKDPYLTLKEEPGFKDRVSKFFDKHQNKRVGFSIFPEGELPFWGVQFPLFANFGAFKIARRAAVENAGKRPVFYIEAHANFLRYVTATKDAPIRIDIIEPELVPNHALTDRDEWIESRRAAFEQRANDPERRGEMYDLIDRKKIPGGRINTTEVPRRYVPVREAGEQALQADKAPVVRSCRLVIAK